ncbi:MULTISPECIES: ArsR/SmtB family transcription factor [unclassified Dietzia]|uniref:ArsR/SmtB family transcription factor n=2 Tax=Dietzia TaxID=37914 RepID=UPI0015F8237C|nr:MULTISPECIES: helix-turn-helix domain-containing protein [unclassified Dietzia]MBB1023524.1 helix-turn-helix transcriptional regulator [Dietzia sp. DQ12-76]
MQDIGVIDSAEAATAALAPMRTRLLAELAEPGSATTLAARLGVPRQKLNYHLRQLEKHGLVELVEERRRGNVTERILRASSSSFVVSPGVMGRVQPAVSTDPDQASPRWLLALASRMVREVGELVGGARRTGKQVGTFGLDGEVRFATPADRAAFADELTDAVTRLVSRYHDDSAEGGRRHRLVLGMHAVPPGTGDTAGSSAPGDSAPGRPTPSSSHTSRSSTPDSASPDSPAMHQEEKNDV